MSNGQAPPDLPAQQREWLKLQYETVRNEIGSRATSHHSMLSWATAIAAAALALMDASEALGDWRYWTFLAALAIGAVVGGRLAVRHTRRLGDYARALERQIGGSLQIRPDSDLSGWEHHFARERWNEPVWVDWTENPSKPPPRLGSIG
jgi:hypothetical protein